jgi:hypothetical protein
MQINSSRDRSARERGVIAIPRNAGGWRGSEETEFRFLSAGNDRFRSEPPDGFTKFAYFAPYFALGTAARIASIERNALLKYLSSYVPQTYSSLKLKGLKSSSNSSVLLRLAG